MQWKSVLPAAILLVALMPAAAPAFQTVSFLYGIGTEEVDTYRIEGQKDLGFRWWESPRGGLALSLVGGVDYLYNEEADAFAISLAPLLTYEFRSGGPVAPFIEAGVGAAYITETRVGDQDLGINFQFENIFGGGIRLGERKKHDFRLRVLHYSNANLDTDNEGLTFLTLSYHYRF